jgi:GT2 family glycosyltransferase
VKVLQSYPYTISGIVVSFNTRELLRECITSLLKECDRLPQGVNAEILVVDNNSNDGSQEMVEQEFSLAGFPVRLIRSSVNLGFGGANNLALEQAEGRYVVLLNSDAFLHSGSLRLALEHIESSPLTGIGGAKLVSRDGDSQPSARSFHSILNDGFTLTGLSARFPKSRVFAALDRSWADPNIPADVDWVPGAFMMIRREALAKAGAFDPRFFLYYEETDLCKRVQAAGYRISYWPDVVVTHIGGESAKQLSALPSLSLDSRMELWRMRSMLLYYRKHHGSQVWLVQWLEQILYVLRWLRNCWSKNSGRRRRAVEAIPLAKLMRRAWRDTQGGRVSPPSPW